MNRTIEVAMQLLGIFADRNLGPGSNVPLKSILLASVRQGGVKADEYNAALKFLAEQGWITFTPGGGGGMGMVALTEAGYDKAHE